MPSIHLVTIPSAVISSPSKPATWATQTERGSAVLLRVLCRLVLWSGRPIARALLHPIVAYFALTSPSARASSKAYLSRVHTRPASWIDYYRHLYAFATVLLDRVYFLHGRFDNFKLRTFNPACVRDECNAGRGGFLIGAHLGSFESISAVGRDNTNLRLQMLMYQAHAQKLQPLLQSLNPNARYGILPLGHTDTMLKASEHLSSGGFIGMLADRTFDQDTHANQSLRVSFLGQSALFPLGAFKIAALLRRPVYFMVGLYQGGNRYDIHFEPLYDFSQTKNRSLAVQEAAQIYADRLAHYCRLSPYNWFNFYDFWQTKN